MLRGADSVHNTALPLPCSSWFWVGLFFLATDDKFVCSEVVLDEEGGLYVGFSVPWPSLVCGPPGRFFDAVCCMSYGTKRDENGLEGKAPRFQI